MMPHDQDRSYDSGNNYRTTPTVDLHRLRDKMYLLTQSETLTAGSRELARIELAYMDNMIAFREETTPKQRARLVREDKTPWQGTWRRKQQ